MVVKEKEKDGDPDVPPGLGFRPKTNVKELGISVRKTAAIVEMFALVSFWP
ncbi:unnamed protein product [Dovyalis caffra]|uniref:Uncharacterized protein n=1 Tax=Dovyalis caffra TaxID=77055 RepID=A0AAV1RT22_9ROSI|nr:unnamed protein product [Dovyalis caffra]